jgi:hypothetical protein
LNVGSEMLIVGYGRVRAADPTSAGLRLEQRVRMSTLGAGQVTYGAATCHGDSGGPAFAEDALVAVTSSGPENCREYGRSTLVDANDPFFDVAFPGAAGSGCG